MPKKKKKFSSRFPPARVKKIMQSDEDIGKVAAPVPVVISKALEIFVESLLTKSLQQTRYRNAKTMSTSHIKQCIESESTFDFLKDLVENVPDRPCAEDNEGSHQQMEARPKQPRPRKKRVKEGTAGPSKVTLTRQSSEEQSSSQADSDTDNNEAPCNRHLIDPSSRGVAPLTILNSDCAPGFPTQATPPSPLPMYGCHTPQLSIPIGTLQLGMGMYQASRSNTLDDDDNYDT